MQDNKRKQKEIIFKKGEQAYVRAIEMEEKKELSTGRKKRRGRV